MTVLDSERTRTAFGKFATGVCIVTAVGDDGPIGMTVSSFNSVSLDPPLVLWSVGQQAPEYAEFCCTSYYVIHVLSSGQAELSNRFATPGIDKFEGLDCKYTIGNLPLLPDVVVRFHCNAQQNVVAGDHNILVGQVVEVDLPDGEDEVSPLIYHGSSYRKVGTLL